MTDSALEPFPFELSPADRRTAASARHHLRRHVDRLNAMAPRSPDDGAPPGDDNDIYVWASGSWCYGYIRRKCGYTDRGASRLVAGTDAWRSFDPDNPLVSLRGFNPHKP